MLELKPYQKRTLEDLERYLKLSSEVGPQTAFIQQTNRPYHLVPGLEGLPYVCLRVPTGGGKTFMACYAVADTSRVYLEAETPVCLWLVPSNAIREQTLASLRDKRHPYRQTLDQSFQGRVSVLDLSEALYVQRGTLDSGLTIVVATIAAFRVEDTEGRKLYEANGALDHHFSGISPDHLARLEKREDETFPPSLANVLRLRRPLIIMDEAHNARTSLSFETLIRLQPSAILEFTATPATEHNPAVGRFSSNVLTHVSAAELKAENMVKLPIKLFTHHEWKEVVSQAIQMQGHLEKKAELERKTTGEYLRPIVLLQAQPHREGQETVNVEVLKKTLLEDFRIPEDYIAVATSESRGIENVNLMDASCPIRFIITVQALREGWDCSFAYILCSVSEQSGARAVEQILGRILRLAGAKRKKEEMLNVSYAFVASPRFISTAESLKDALVDNGFERLEAADLIQSVSEEDNLLLNLTPIDPISEVVTEKPDLKDLPASLINQVSFDSRTQRIAIKRPLSNEEVSQIEKCFSQKEDRQVVRQLAEKAERINNQFQALMREKISVPLLAVRGPDGLELFEATHFLDRPWDIGTCEAALSRVEFSTAVEHGSAGIVDVATSGQIVIRSEEIETLRNQLSLLQTFTGWTVPILATWLDQRIPHSDIPQAQSQLFIRRILGHLIEGRRIPIEELVRHKYRLRDAIERKINDYRVAEHKQFYQTLLFGKTDMAIEVSPEISFKFDPARYAPNWLYEGSYKFQKHIPPQKIGELKGEGEEFECAQYLDSLPDIVCWIRNVERRPESSFWLQTSTDRFYPDFICKLQDGRILVVEHKGEDRFSNDDSIEKRALGELWAEKSNGTCFFVMTRGRNFEVIGNEIRSVMPVQSQIIELDIVPFKQANPFVTHLPVYSLKAAAGKFSDSQDVEELGWAKIENHKLNREMFVAQVCGHSMEPKIPDGSYCVFRAHPAGSRQGKIVLAQYRGPSDAETGGQFTVKRYESTKLQNPDGTWEHEKIRLEPINPKFQPIEINPRDSDDIRVLAELIDVID